MPKPKAIEPAERWNITIPGSLAAELELLLLDPMRNSPIYGARVALIVSLLSAWVERYKRGELHPDDVTLEQLRKLGV